MGLDFGSLFVLENYDRDKKLSSLAVIIKIKGYNPGKGDWHWFHYAPDGKVLATGRVDTRIQCHEAMKDNDFIMTAPIK